MNNFSSNKTTRIAGNCLIFFGSFVLIASSGAKLAHVPKVVNELGAMGYEGTKFTLIAITELLSAVLFAIPKTRSFALLLISSYMGGAIATHVQHDQSFIQPAIILTILWVGTWLRHPESLWSLNTSTQASGQVATNIARTGRA